MRRWLNSLWYISTVFALFVCHFGVDRSNAVACYIPQRLAPRVKHARFAKDTKKHPVLASDPLENLVPESSSMIVWFRSHFGCMAAGGAQGTQLIFFLPFPLVHFNVFACHFGVGRSEKDEIAYLLSHVRPHPRTRQFSFSH